MATIRQRTKADGTTAYHVQVRLKGHPTQTASFPWLTDARQWAARIESDLREGRHLPGTAAKRYTLADLIERYRKTILPRKSPRTIDVQTAQLRWWNAQIGHLRVPDVTPAVIAEKRDLLSHTHKPGSVTRYLASISHLFTMAVEEWKLLEANPVHRVRKPREPQWRVRFLSEDERTRLLAACRASPHPYLYIIVVLALSTGAHKMEIYSVSLLV